MTEAQLSFSLLEVNSAVKDSERLTWTSSPSDFALVFLKWWDVILQTDVSNYH